MSSIKIKKEDGTWEYISSSSGGNIDIDINESNSDEIDTYLKPQSPLYHSKEDAYFYPVTTVDQVIMTDGSKLDVKLNDLSEKVRKKADTETFKVVLHASGWSESEPFEQIGQVVGLLSTDYPFVDVDLSEVENAQSVIDGWGLVGRVTVNSDDSIIAYCYGEKPVVDIPIVFKVVR